MGCRFVVELKYENYIVRKRKFGTSLAKHVMGKTFHEKLLATACMKSQRIPKKSWN
jgi:hypothetical protein